MSKINSASHLKRNDLKGNVRILATLRAAQAVLVSSEGSPSTIRIARHALKRLLPKVKHLPFHHEQVLEALVILYADSSGDDERAAGQAYSDELRRSFIERRYSELAREENCEVAQTPFALPDLAFGVERPLKALTLHSTEPRRIPIEQLRRIEAFDAKVRNNLASRGLTIGYKYWSAENWTIVADCIDGRDGWHGWRVGRVASTISVGLGLDSEESRVIDLVCRLHDIGNVFMR